MRRARTACVRKSARERLRGGGGVCRLRCDCAWAADDCAAIWEGNDSGMTRPTTWAGRDAACSRFAHDAERRNRLDDLVRSETESAHAGHR